ncbi:sensor histidine kinase [Terriglobus tenax]|uniref:sensor histidine kinase n=1 Tax=Terriglobus tenax TaxID=1111115 RepID=UPI0021E0A68D|nr:HAMP domain-containing sensor histidine kinase [Terriglobus tenax]
MRWSNSIARRLIAAVLLLEGLAGVFLIVAVTVNERQNQYKTFDANLRASANSLFGAVQEAGDTGNVSLNQERISLGPHAIYRVMDDRGQVLGMAGVMPDEVPVDGSFLNRKVHRRAYRFFALAGERVVDAGAPGSVVRRVNIVYGQPVDRIWHEVFEATRFFAGATALLLGLTAILLVWMVRRLLSPILLLAGEADKVTSVHWSFTPPETAMQYEELRPLGAAIERTVGRLQRSFEQQRRFTRDAAHELKTDLAIVKSSLQLLTMRERTAEEYAKGLAIGLDDFTRLEETVQKMLILARLEQPADAIPSSCALHQVLQDTVTQSHAFAAMKHIAVSLSPIASVVVGLDSRDAALLCSNLVVNALQHSHDNSQVEVSLRRDGETAILTIRDHGEGIREEDLAHLFEPFYRGDASRSRKSGGTGLGLSICKAICERAGGSIEIANHPRGGAVATVCLPLTERQAE